MNRNVIEKMYLHFIALLCSSTAIVKNEFKNKNNLQNALSIE